jgi:ribosomal protein S18 acetylase RimI-like enzyme
VRSPETIYVGGIQLLPEFQGKGIGTAIFKDIISESEVTGIPVTLEVHHVNEKAISFYRKLGFQETGKTEKQILMKYVPVV